MSIVIGMKNGQLEKPAVAENVGTGADVAVAGGNPHKVAAEEADSCGIQRCLHRRERNFAAAVADIAPFPVRLVPIDDPFAPSEFGVDLPPSW